MSSAAVRSVNPFDLLGGVSLFARPSGGVVVVASSFRQPTLPAGEPYDDGGPLLLLLLDETRASLG